MVRDAAQLRLRHLAGQPQEEGHARAGVEVLLHHHLDRPRLVVVAYLRLIIHSRASYGDCDGCASACQTERRRFCSSRSVRSSTSSASMPVTTCAPRECSSSSLHSPMGRAGTRAGAGGMTSGLSRMWMRCPLTSKPNSPFAV